MSTTKRQASSESALLDKKRQRVDSDVNLALLATAQVRIQIGTTIIGPFRALCDTGSQLNLITDTAVRMNYLPTKQCSMRIAGINATTKQPFTRKVVGHLLSRSNDEPIMDIELLVMPGKSISHLPNEKLSIDIVPADDITRLADPVFNVPTQVDILLGAGVYAECVLAQHKMTKAGIIMQESRLGLLLYGGGTNRSISAAVNHAVFDKTDEKLSKTLQRFWELEEISASRTRTSAQQQCEEFFIKTHQRMSDGRYVVGIPLRSDVDQLGSSRETAIKRFHQLERRFARDPELHKKYCAGMMELIASNQMSEVTRPPHGWCYHIPHHPVLKKFRIVFDASCKTDQGISLNETQLVGEKLQDNLFDLIMRFRTHRIGITADIRKMYLQVGIHPHQWDLQRVIWRANPQEKLKEYWLTVVTFGMASAPHCAVRAMQQCAEDESKDFPQASRIVKSDFYMDDCLTGADDKAEARQLRQELVEMLAKGCFILDKWHSNEPDVVSSASTVCQSSEAVELSEADGTTVLGLRWLPITDELTFKFKPLLQSPRRETMREVLSQIARLFDPNGYLGPAIIIAKIIMQRIWESGIGWDEHIPPDIAHDWAQLQKQLPELTKIKIPRWLGTGPKVGFSLHGFADASEKAYGAVVYVRVETTNEIQCRIIASRSRVAPLKKVTIPRLELCAAKLLAELLQAIKSSCNFNFIKSTLWTDSAIVLQWIKKDGATLKSFVHNRVQSILSTAIDCDWRHVPTETNPADLLSRGVAPDKLRASEIWWQGPKWLKEGSSEWPNSQQELSLHIEKEVRAEMKASWLDYANDQPLRIIQKAHVNKITLQMRGDGRFSKKIADMTLRTSTLRRLVRRTAYIRRFFHNYCHKKTDWRLEPLTEGEEEEALWCVIRREQAICYKPELKALRNKDEGLPVKSQILCFNPYIDANGILRIGGRIEAAVMPYEQKHPALLPEVSHVAQLLIREAHKETLHGGRQLMTAHLRQRFWITGLRRAIQTNNKRCVSCIRHKREVAEQLMGSLPADRVQQSDPFQHSGIDFAGPFQTKPRPGRCKLRDKKWVAVFICMATKAVHLELVDSLSTEDFIKAFIRFTSLRGKCTHLWSDNGTNFVGADSELERMAKTWVNADTDAYRELRESMKINWHFITPSAPHQGGLWEAAVKSMKFHMRRLIGGQILLDCDMRTILAQITAVLNSRPLTALSDDHEDLGFLTPNQLLNLRPMSQFFGEQVEQKPKNLLARFELTQYLAQQFWKSWHSEYLTELQQRPKWKKARENMKIGDLVLIKEDNMLPTMWKTGRITKTFAGADGWVRNVQLRVAGKKRLTERPIQKLCLLPLQEVEESADSARGQCVATGEISTDSLTSSERIAVGETSSNSITSSARDERATRRAARLL